MSRSKKQSLIITAIALIIIGIILAVFALSQPKIYVDDSSASVAVSDMDYTEPVTDVSAQEAEMPINLNTCTYDELLTVEGIGDARASAIIEYRDVIGSYSTVDEIKNISGIGESLFEKISPFLCV